MQKVYRPVGDILSEAPHHLMIYSSSCLDRVNTGEAEEQLIPGGGGDLVSPAVGQVVLRVVEECQGPVAPVPQSLKLTNPTEI